MATTTVDLARLREVVLDNRRSGEDRPRERSRRIFVDPTGKIVFGDRVGDDEARQLSEVHPAVFA